MASLNTYSKVFHWMLGIFSLAICFAPILAPAYISITIALFVAVILIGLVNKHLKVKFYSLFLVLVLFYLAYVIGVIFSQDFALGLKYLEYKLFFLLIPLAFSVQPKFEISLKLPVIALMISTIAIGVIGFVNAFNCFESYPYVVPCFTSSNISPIHHPSYFSMYLLVAVFTAWTVFKNHSKMNKVWLVLYTVYAFIMYLLCLSMAGLIFILVLGAIWSFVMFKRRFGNGMAIVFVCLTSITLYFVATHTEALRNEIETTKVSVKEYFADKNGYLETKSKQVEINGNETRLIMWTVTLDLIKENPFGTGTGSLDIIISNRLKEHGLYDFAEKNYNPHNQYFQTALEIGVIGLVLLLFIYYFGLKLAIEFRSKSLFVLVFGFMFNCLFESMFQRQSGIFFFVFWVCLLVVFNTVRKYSINRNNESMAKEGSFETEYSSK